VKGLHPPGKFNSNEKRILTSISIRKLWPLRIGRYMATYHSNPANPAAVAPPIHELGVSRQLDPRQPNVALARYPGAIGQSTSPASDFPSE
jgi:hypothetical protein